MFKFEFELHLFPGCAFLSSTSLDAISFKKVDIEERTKT